MLLIVAKVINLVTLTIQFMLYAASCVGQIIVQILTRLWSAIYNIASGIYTLFQIVYEDNIEIFTDELPSAAHKLYESIVNQCDIVLNTLISFGSYIQFKVFAAFDTVKWSVNTLCIIFIEVLSLVKHTIVFAGDTTWLLLTFLPLHLPQLLKELFRSIGLVILDITVKAYISLLNFSKLATDVPLESFLGMMSALLLYRLCWHFREGIQTQIANLYWSLIRQFYFVYYATYNYVTDSEVRVIAGMSGNDDVGSRRFIETLEDEVDDGSDNLCVICQERQKCVLTLPCRHICLCTECCKRLYNYQRTCPICRTFIYHSVTVYL